MSLGALPDPRDPRDKPVGYLFSSAGKLPDAVSYRFDAGEVLHQQTTNACTGGACSKQAETWARIRGIRIGRISMRAIYWLGRYVGRREGEVVVDGGAYPRQVSRALHRYGYVEEAACPFSVARINEDLDVLTLRDACSHNLDLYFRVDSVGAAKTQAIRDALARGYIPTATIDVDAAFDQGVGEIGPMVGPSRGLHRIVIVGYRPGAFLIMNSWGVGWGDSGFAWISEARIADPGTRDIEVVTLASL